MSSDSVVAEIDLATWSNLTHNLADLFLLGLGEDTWYAFVATDIQCLEFSLPGEDDKQQTQGIVGTFKPKPLHHDGEALQGAELSIGESLEELGAI